VELRPSYPVTTTRLALRPLTTGDVESLLSYRSLPAVCRYVPFEPMTAEVIADNLAATWDRSSLDDEGQSLHLGVVVAERDRLVGDVVLRWDSRVHGGGEIGYVFHPDVTGNGYATEAMHAVLHLAFDDLGLHRLTARIDARNAPSGRVCERLGMRAEAHLLQNEWLKGEWTDEIDYAILRSEWPTGAVATGCRRCSP
jgi:RimJ/RimL family protein N-acetyltransferase